MKNLKHLILSIITLATLLAVLPVSQVAAVNITKGVCDEAGNRPAVCGDAQRGSTGNPLLGKDGLVTKGIQIFLIVVGIISVFAMMINATKMITANGDANSIAKARNGILYAAIGLVVAMSAQIIIIALVNKLN